MEQNGITVTFLAEYATNIGSGHVAECIYLLDHLLRQRIKTSLWVNESVPASLIRNYKDVCNTVSFFTVPDVMDRVIKALLAMHCDIVICNFRKVTNETLQTLKQAGFTVICIDEINNRYLACDAIINHSIVSKYHNYTAHNPHLCTYTGPRFLPLAPGFIEAHKCSREFQGGIGTISVSMGGVDRTGVTLLLMDILADWNDAVVKNIILGAGFLQRDEVYKKMSSLTGKNFKIFEAVPHIESIFMNSDVVFSAGGNTLYELACIGTPAIVLYEDEHEKENGQCFAQHDFGIYAGRGVDATREQVFTALNSLQDPHVRLQQARNGKDLVDGRGAERIYELIQAFAKKEKKPL